MYHRFELFIDGEKQDIGLLMGVSELDLYDDEMLDNLTSNFEKFLPIPSYYKTNVEEKKYVRAYFTEKGMDFFKEDIFRLVDAFEEQGLFDVREFLIEEDEANIVYKDEFQVLVKCT